MRLALALGRLNLRTDSAPCLNRLPRLLRRATEAPYRYRRIAASSSSAGTPARFRPQQWRGSRARPRILLAAANGALATAAFVKLSEKENDGPEDTGEKRMLEVSRKEIKKAVDESDTGLTRIRHQVVLFLDLYIWEPVCTGARFLQLVVIFVPVLLTVPVIWIGSRQPERDNERAGTLWWYGFLVKAMEWAGPAFIKVCR